MLLGAETYEIYDAITQVVDENVGDTDRVFIEEYLQDTYIGKYIVAEGYQKESINSDKYVSFRK